MFFTTRIHYCIIFNIIPIQNEYFNNIIYNVTSQNFLKKYLYKKIYLLKNNTQGFERKLKLFFNNTYFNTVNISKIQKALNF